MDLIILGDGDNKMVEKYRGKETIVDLTDEVNSSNQLEELLQQGDETDEELINENEEDEDEDNEEEEQEDEFDFESGYPLVEDD